MAKVRILNSTPGAITLMAYNNAGQLMMTTIPAASVRGPGEATIDEDLLETLKKKDDRAVAARFAAGHLRIANQNTIQEEAPLTPVPDTPEATPPVPAAPEVPAVPEAPAADNDVPQATDNTPPDAPWATGNS